MLGHLQSQWWPSSGPSLQAEELHLDDWKAFPYRNSNIWKYMVNPNHYCDVTSAMKNLKSLATWLFDQKLIQAKSKKLNNTGPYWEEFTGDSQVLVLHIWVRSQRCCCLVTWFYYQLIAKPGKKTATLSCPHPYIDGLVQDCSNFIANALELLQSCTKQLIWGPNLVITVPYNATSLGGAVLTTILDKFFSTSFSCHHPFCTTLADQMTSL